MTERMTAAKLPGRGANGQIANAIAAPLWESIAAIIDARSERLVKLRRLLHATPEPSNEEVATTALIAQTLREAGLQPRVMQNEVGVIVDLDLGAAGGTFIAGRAELDGVRVDDDKQVPYASTKPGLCHACGHDVHATALLGAILSIAERRDELVSRGMRHNVRCIFQPAEESATGARSMIEQGALGGVEAIAALHVEPFMETGTIGVRRGAMTAACKTFRINVQGKSGHSARPYQALDPIPAAINIVSLFYQLAPRSVDARNPLAITVASIQSGASFNAIPDRAIIAGALRTTREEDLAQVQARMQAICEGVAHSTGCEVVIEFPEYAPATKNDLAVLSAIVEAGREIVGADGVQWIDLPSMGAEDFSFYQQLIPGAFARIGAARPGSEMRSRKPLHSSLFDVDEASIPLATKVMSRTLLELAATYEPKRV